MNGFFTVESHTGCHRVTWIIIVEDWVFYLYEDELIMINCLSLINQWNGQQTQSLNLMTWLDFIVNNWGRLLFDCITTNNFISVTYRQELQWKWETYPQLSSWADHIIKSNKLMWSLTQHYFIYTCITYYFYIISTCSLRVVTVQCRKSAPTVWSVMDFLFLSTCSPSSQIIHLLNTTRLCSVVFTFAA